MELAGKPYPYHKQASVSEARLAYFAGDFERCLAICADIRIRSLATASEVALLNARAYLRTGRPKEAAAGLVETANTHTSLDASLSAQMLLGTARIRQGDADAGLSILEAAATRSAHAHVAIRSEISFATALGHWAKRDIEAAERALGGVDRRSDIIHARGLELAAWCQMARGNYRRCAELFIATLERLDSCRAQDKAIAAAAISTLSILGAELCDHEIARVAQLRAGTMEWTSGLQMQQFLTLLHQSLFAEVTGNAVAAYEFAIQARGVAPTVACEASAWGVSSTIARNADEPCAAAVYAKHAVRLLAGHDLRQLAGEERLSLLVVAECCAHVDIDSAEQVFAAYSGLDPIDKMVALSGDPRLAAEESFVAGAIAEARGDATEAERSYRRAFEQFARIGYVRRAAIAALALVKLCADNSMRYYLVEQFESTSNYITRYLACRFPNRFAALENHPIVASLPPAQREVIALICQGKSNKEIAALRNVGEQTIKNMLTKDVFRAFGVSSRAALISTCLRGTH
jgi:DNA-binding CsgD family transcriptional regulator